MYSCNPPHKDSKSREQRKIYLSEVKAPTSKQGNLSGKIPPPLRPVCRFMLLLPHETLPYRFGWHRLGAGHSRHFRAVTAYHAVPVARRCAVGAFLAPALRMAVKPPVVRGVHSSLSRNPCHTASCQSRFAFAHVGNDALLCLCPAVRNALGAGVVACNRVGRFVAHPFFSDIAQIVQKIVYLWTFITILLTKSLKIFQG